jgi:sodium transport system ATP-binding protein
MKGTALETRVNEVLELFDITEYADRPNDRLSTGMKQRVGLARAAVHDPPVLILDEPTTGLDPIVSRTVEQAVIALARRGKCVLFSTHLLGQAEDICDRIGVISGGRVVAEGTIQQLTEQTGAANLRSAFFSLVGAEQDDESIRPLREAVPISAAPTPEAPGGSAS